ncbi:uncharacterized protein F5891DRAFT_1192000 [Suillus fuscotomentosus]|uniref:Uncharacterized protein n=1 Tax=Suillus fuscotomentosus TaxID=1912939 RepID=A0AAD4E0W6_9AGAM|nr:uncharacterized protein F5891DRAFT_1192000 [Suillus fuscotomentosus]KAG1897302.1 hypothetical protein F5891DRAFT_1192000 [Suillus fuscotomentosus]
MTQDAPDNPPSSHSSYVGLSSDTFDYMQEQFGGGRRCATPPVELTPSRLRSKLKATARDVGLVKGASIRRQAYENLTVGDQDPTPVQSSTTDFTHMVADGTSTNETSSLTGHVASSRHASPFPTTHAPAQLQDIFYGSMSQQPAWMDPNSSDAFSMMGTTSFLPGGSQHHLITQDMNRLAPPPSFNFPTNSSGQTMASRACSLEPHATGQTPSGFTQDFSGEVAPFILRPVPSSSPQDHAPPLPATNIIPPTPFQTNTSTSTNSIGVVTTFHQRFPEEHEPVTHQEGNTVTGRRSAELNTALDVGFAAVERCFLDLSTSTTLPVSQLINLFLKSRGRTVNGTNYWNLYANYFKEHIKTELARIGREAPAGGGTPSATVHTQCYDKFKEAYPESYQDLLLMHKEALLLGSSTQTIAQRGQGFQKHYRRVIQILDSASAKCGFEAAVVLCGKVVNEDGSLGHSYSMPGAAGFWQTRCRASDDAIIGHLKAHVYNNTSLATVDEVFHDDTHSDSLTPRSTSNNGREQSQAPEGRDDGLKWVKLELIKQVAQLGGKCAWDENFPWKGMSSALADANICIRGYPADRCLLPGEAHNENSKNKGIGALTQREIVVLVEALKSGTMQVVKVDKVHRASVMASERPVITGIAPPSDWPHAGARRLFVNGDTDYHGPARLKSSNAATKVKKADKATKAPPPPDDDDDDSSDDDHPVVPAVQIAAPPPIPPPFKVVALPPSRPFKIVPKPEPTAAHDEVIELTSAGENVATEPDSEYEEARGKKRKLKSRNTSHASKKPASSNEKADVSKVGKKAAHSKQPKVPALPTSTTSPTKGGPLSPLTVGSSSVAASPEPKAGAAAVASRQDGPSNVRTKVKPRPITRESKGTMKHALRMAYSHSDGSEVDEGKKMDVAVKSAVSPALDNVAVETVQEDLPSEAQTTNPVEEDLHHIVHDPHNPPDTTHQAHDELPVHRNPPEGIQRGSNEAVQRDPHEGDPIHHPREPQREVVPLRNPHEPRHNVLHDPRDIPHHAPRDILRDPRQPLRSHSREPWYMHEAVHRREVHHLREDSPIIERDALHPRDAFYHHDLRNPRYPSLQPHDRYGSNEPHANSDFTTRDSSPALEVYRDDHYAHGERERTYPGRYSPVLGPEYAHESGYSRRDDLDERRAFGGGAYRESGYPPRRTRHLDSRWMDRRNAPSLDYAHHEAVPRSFSRDPVDSPRPPSS